MSKELREAEQRDALYAVDQSQSQGGEQGGATHVIPTDRLGLRAAREVGPAFT